MQLGPHLILNKALSGLSSADYGKFKYAHLILVGKLAPTPLPPNPNANKSQIICGIGMKEKVWQLWGPPLTWSNMCELGISLRSRAATPMCDSGESKLALVGVLTISAPRARKMSTWQIKQMLAFYPEHVLWAQISSKFGLKLIILVLFFLS